jgi:hypothetical protein
MVTRGLQPCVGEGRRRGQEGGRMKRNEGEEGKDAGKEGKETGWRIEGRRER